MADGVSPDTGAKPVGKDYYMYHKTPGGVSQEKFGENWDKINWNKGEREKLSKETFNPDAASVPGTSSASINSSEQKAESKTVKKRNPSKRTKKPERIDSVAAAKPDDKLETETKPVKQEKAMPNNSPVGKEEIASDKAPEQESKAENPPLPVNPKAPVVAPTTPVPPETGKIKVETPEARLARIEKEIADKIAAKIEEKRISGKGPIFAGERLAIAQEIYLRELKGYSINKIPGFKGEIGRFFAFLSGKENVEVRSDKGEVIKTSKINWMFQHPSQELVDFLKNEFENTTRRTRKEAILSTLPSAGVQQPKEPVLPVPDIGNQLRKQKNLDFVKSELGKADKGEPDITGTITPELVSFLTDNSVSDDEIRKMMPEERWVKAKELLESKNKEPEKPAEAIATTTENAANLGTAQEQEKKTISEKAAAVAKPEILQAEIKTGPAVWKNKVGDQPVKIIGDAGMGPDKRHYVYIEGSTSGIPLDEIEYPKEAVV
jgi:hypothetical protein